MSLLPSQAVLFSVADQEGLQLPCNCRYLPNFLAIEEADNLLLQLRTQLPLQQQSIRMFGKQVIQPRLICWQADPDVNYGYSGIRLVASEWHPLIAQLRQRLGKELGLEFNSVLINAYRDGQDSMGWHSDDEPELGPDPVLASISLGAERRFRWRYKGLTKSRAEGAGDYPGKIPGKNPGQNSDKNQSMKLHHGSLLLLDSLFQHRYQHSVPKTRTVTGLRINLTFRRVITKVKQGVA